MSSKCRKSAYACFCCFSKGEVSPKPTTPKQNPSDVDTIVEPIPAQQNEKNISTLLEQTIQSISVLNRVLANYQKDQKKYDHNNNEIQTELSIATDEIIREKLDIFETQYAEFKQLTTQANQPNSAVTHPDNIIENLTIIQPNSVPIGGSLPAYLNHNIEKTSFENILSKSFHVQNKETIKRFNSTKGINSESAENQIKSLEPIENQPEPYWLSYYSVLEIPKQNRPSKEQSIRNLVEGRNGSIYEATYEGQKVVVKKIKLNCALNWEKLGYDSYIPLEVTLMTKVLKSPHCIQYIDWAVDDDYVKIIMEAFKAPIDLRNLMNYLYGVPEFLSKFIFEKIVRACLQIKERQVLHLDIKPDNVLIDLGHNELIVKIIDFGSALHYTSETLTNLFSTHQVTPIEFLQQRKCNGDEATVWSIGISLYFVSYFKCPSDSPEKIATTNVEYKNDEIYQQRNDLIRKCLAINPSERIRLEDILKHSWFQTISDFKCSFSAYEDSLNNFKEYGFNNLKRMVRFDNKLVACKQIFRESFNHIEVDKMFKCKDIAGCAKLIDFFFMAGSIYLIMEPFEDYIALSDHKIADENELKIYFKQILKTCAEIKEKDVLFIDFHQKKILVNTKTKMIKLVDFEKACFISNNNRDAQSSQLISLRWCISDLCLNQNLTISQELGDLIKALDQAKIKFEDIFEHPWLKN